MTRLLIVLMVVVLGASAATMPPQDTSAKLQQALALESSRLGQCAAALAEAQPYRTQAIAGVLVNGAATVNEVELRIATLFAKENPGKTIDPKTGKVKEVPPGKGNGKE